MYRPDTWWTGVRRHGGHFLIFEIVIMHSLHVKRSYFLMEKIDLKVEKYARCETPKPFWASRHRSLESRLEIERLTSGLEGGWWKSAQSSNSLAAYPTARSVLRGGRAAATSPPYPTTRLRNLMSLMKRELTTTSTVPFSPY